MTSGLRLLLLFAPTLLAGCDLLGVETLSQQQARQTAKNQPQRKDWSRQLRKEPQRQQG